MTSADFSPTIGADVYAEGPFEGIYRSILTTDHETAEFQFQVGAIHWTTRSGEDRHYTLDGGRITIDGVERWFEMKACAGYFQLPDVADLLDQAEEVLARHDIVLDRLDGSKLLEPVRLRAVHEVLRHRNVPFEQRDVAAALACIENECGVAPYGAVASALKTDRRRAHAVLASMLIRRSIGFPLHGPITPETPVTAFRRPTRRLTRPGV